MLARGVVFKSILSVQRRKATGALCVLGEQGGSKKKHSQLIL